MSPLESPGKELDEKYVGMIVKFVSDVKTGKLEGSNNIALATVALLEQIIGDAQHATAYQLVGVVREAGRQLTRALPHELIAANMVRRVLRAIRDEQRAPAHAALAGAVTGAGESLQRLVQAGARRATLCPSERDLREPLRDHIAELRAELESSHALICSEAGSHVHADELILTNGGGALVERFLRTCVARRYRLIVAEGGAAARAHGMAARLAAHGVRVTVVGDAAVCGLMSRVNKVLLGVRAALPDGALLAGAGAYALAAAAKLYSVPVVALAPLYKLCPLHACDQHHVHAPAPPGRSLRYGSVASNAAHVFAPQWDLVPPDHVSLFITNLGGSSPSNIYRLHSELYDPQDHQI